MVAAHNMVNRRRPRILVTDDDPGWREVMREALEPRGYETLEATSGEEAIDLLHEEKLHLLILDLQLPHLSGLDTLKIVREEVGDALPAIVVSSRVSDDVLRQALALHAFTVLSKMVDVHRLLYTVARALEQYHRRLQEADPDAPGASGRDE